MPFPDMSKEDGDEALEVPAKVLRIPGLARRLKDRTNMTKSRGPGKEATSDKQLVKTQLATE